MYSGKKPRHWMLVTISITLAILFSAIPAAHADYVTTPINVGNSPHYVAFDSIKGNIYVANADDNTVSVISGTTKAVTNTIAVGNSPNGIAFDSIADNIYVTNTGSNTVSVISGITKAVTNTITVGTNPYGVAFDSIKDNIYVTNTGSNTVSVISGITKAVTNTITVGTNPYGVAFDSINDNIYVTNSADNTVSVISGTTKAVINTIAVGTNPYSASFVSVNDNIYVTNIGSNTVSVISGITKAVTNTIAVGNSPNGVAFDSIKGNIYVANAGDGTVSVISGITKAVTNTITVGTNPYGVAFDSINDNIYVTNSADNTVSVIITAASLDTIPPVLTLPAAITTPATSILGAVVTYTVTATDNQGTPTVLCVTSSGSMFPIGTTTVTCKAVDSSGNVATGSFPITVQPLPDTIPPIFTVPPGDQTFYINDPSGMVVTYTVAATDNSGSVTVSCTTPSGATFIPGITTVTCTATDPAGNVATTSFKITVVLQIDSIPPTFSLTNVTAEASGPLGSVVKFTSTATDNYGTPTVTCTPTSGSQFPIGTTAVTCTAMDGGLNTATTTFAVTVKDTTPPLITAPANIIVAASGQLTKVNLGLPTFSDIVDPNPIITNNAPSLGFLAGTTQVVWTATDHSGNSATATQTVTILNITPGSLGGNGGFGDKITFKDNVQSLDGLTATGLISYSDKLANINLNSITINGFVIDPTRTTVNLIGTATVNGIIGYTFLLYAEDHGSPGTNDLFSIKIFDSHGVQTYAASSKITIGNISIS